MIKLHYNYLLTLQLDTQPLALLATKNCGVRALVPMLLLCLSCYSVGS